MAEEVKYNNTLVSGRADETLTYTKYVKDESSGKSTKELLDEKVNKTDQLGTTQIADKAVTNEKLAEHSVDNSKLSPYSVTSEKIKDESIITEKLNDRAVTTEKVEEKAITNSKLGDQSVDGRVVREASLETKHFANESVTTEKVARKSITKDKLADNSVDASQVVDGSIGNAKLSPDSVTTEKINDSSVTNEKVADDTLGIEKFDPELRKTIQAATGLPEDLSQMIQDVDKSIKQLHEKNTDLKSQIDDNQQQITDNKSAQDAKNASLDENMKKLNTRDDQITETLKNISATGGASVASAVTYDNTTSQLTSANIQGAVDELQGAKIDKTSILQESGEAEDKVMSQKAVSGKFSSLLSKRDFERAYTGQQDFSIDAENNANVNTDLEVFIPQGITVSFKLIHKILNNAGTCIVSFYYDDNTKTQKVIEIGVSDYIITEKAVTKIHFFLDKNYINSNGNIALRISYAGFNEYTKNMDTLKSSVNNLQDSKLDKTSILQESGEAEDKVMSQKAVSTKLSGLHDSIANASIYTGTSPQISAYSGAWCYVKPIYIVKGTKSRITVKSSSNSIRVDEFKLTCVRPDGTYFETSVKFRDGKTVDYIFEDTVVSVGKYAVLTKDGTFSISIKTESITSRVESLENSTNFKYPPYPIWGHEYLSAWYYKMYMSSSQTSFKIVCAGDSTTKNGSRDIYIKRLMTLRGYKDEKVNCLNMGVNGQQTLSWIGYNDKDEITGETTPQYGYLHKQMQESPDLLIIGYGLNDGSNIQFPNLSFEERAANFESRLREGIGRIRTNNAYESGPSYNKSADELSIIIVTPISVSSSNNAKTEATADKWCKLVNPIIKKVCRDFQCAYADFTTREYDHEWSKNWSISKDGVHPDSFIQKEMISMLSDLICPICYTVV